MSTEVTKQNTALPDYLRQYETREKIGNLDDSDRIVPRVKLLQAISPELTEFNEAKQGVFWHNIAAMNLGPKLRAIPVIVRKSYVLWAPRNDDRGILARALDGQHWDEPHLKFTVKPKGAPGPIEYDLKGSVAESGLAEFGSSIPGDKNSVPAASLTYNTLWYLCDFPELSPCVFINTRSSIKPTQQLYNRMDMRPVAHYAQAWDIGVVQQKGDEGPFFNYTYSASGYATQEEAEFTKMLYEKFKAMGNWQASDEEEDVATDGRASRANEASNPEMASKF